MAFRFAPKLRLPHAMWPNTGCQNSIRTTATSAPKKEGDISDAFASLSGMQFEPLDARFADQKTRLVAGHEEVVHASWNRLLSALRKEIPLITSLNSKIIPEIDFADLPSSTQAFRSEHKKRGVAVIRNVIPQSEALALKQDLKDYIRTNPQTKAFPKDNPQVFELYWSPAQIKARSHLNVLKAQQFLMEFWHHDGDRGALVSESHPMIYADRLRTRLPGDAQFALGPHIDGGSCERWEEAGYGRGKVYEKIWQGKWEEYDAWESSCRLPVISDLYQGVGACSMFRMFQGWLSMSSTGPFQGTLLVNPLVGLAISYVLLRPFFSPVTPPPADHDPETPYPDSFLDASNWTLDTTQSSWLQGASPGHGQELRNTLHPHLKLPSTMVHVPHVNPGDYVSWHCDTIHAVDSIHTGKSDSSVMYIPACPLTVANAEFVARQRAAFLAGVPCPDFGGGVGESEHMGRPGVRDVEAVDAEGGMRAFGLKAWDSDEANLTAGQRELMDRANKILGFYD